MNWYVEVLKRYEVFYGRAHPTEYWKFVLSNIIIMIAPGLVDRLFGIWGAPSGVYGLAVLIPGIAVAIRRLHDTNRSDWWLLISMVPVIGTIVLLVFMVLDSQRDANQYGPNPKAARS